MLGIYAKSFLVATGFDRHTPKSALRKDRWANRDRFDIHQTDEGMLRRRRRDSTALGE